MATLAEALNKKILATSLLTTKNSPVPVATQCRFRPASFLGVPACCEESLDAVSVKLALNLVDKLHTLVKPEVPLESRDMYENQNFNHQVNVIAQCMLCDKHRSEFNVKELSGTYIQAIHTTATAEVSNIETLATTLRQKHTEKILQELQVREQSVSKNRSTHKAKQPLSNSWSTPSTAKRSPMLKSKSTTTAPSAWRPGASPPTPTPDPRKAQAASPPTRSGGEREKVREKDNGFKREGDHGNAISPWLTAHFDAQARVESPKVKSSIEIYEERWKAEDPFNAISDSMDEIMRRIPWPMLNRCASEVDEMGVHAFYSAASRENTRNCHDFFNKEKLKWHPDRIDYRFPGVRGVERLKQQASLIFRVLCIVEIKYKEQAPRKGLQLWGVGPEAYFDLTQ
ncbi:hypothetical protein K461DRAFT_295717 [Myriangium duriaei CBS 260.36]|uniref:Uncharacterized protein n=1 Tax=Myriangium duriaei CBS 260.36 TaxID=1168546 RepID=A0A9P4MHX6_9PEZI|nr:hypothetical protein K461DRAFT_295717 [Myriangium duriaei CBS 260.36]